MRRIFKNFIVLSCFSLLLFFRPTTVLANTVEQDDLKVKFTVEQAQNNEDEIKGTVKITNIGIRSIDGINVESILPDGIKLTDDSTLTKEIGKLESGESVSYEFNGKLESLPQPGDDDEEHNPTPGEDGGNNNSNPDKGGAVDNQEPNSGNNSNSPSKGNTSISDKVKTGDDNIILALIILICLCSGLINFLSRKQIKKVLSGVLCLTLIAPLAANTINVQARENDTKTITISESITISEKSYRFETVVSYTKSNDVVEASGDIITRGQWISMLVDAMEIESIQQLEIDDLETIFTDINGHDFEDDIINAVIYSIIDTEEDTFRPDEPATREFAAATSVRALGFQPVQDIICEDANEITYLKEVETAVAMKIINIEGNKFYPLRSLTESEAQYVLEGVSGVLKSTEIDPEYDSEIEFKEGVIEFQGAVSYEVDGDTITFILNEETKNLKKDDIFILPDQTPYKVTKVTIDGDNVIVETVEPQIEETLEYIDAQGYAYLDMSRFVPAEGIEVVQADMPKLRGLNVDVEGSIGGSGTVDFKFKKELANRIELYGDVSIGLPKVLYKADIDIGFFDVDINDVYLKFPFEATVSGGIRTTDMDRAFGPRKYGFIELGSVPVAGVPGVAIVVELALAYDLEGKMSIVFSIEGEVGVQVKNNRPRAIKEFNPDFTPLELEATIKAGPRIAGLLEICKRWNLIDFSLFAGVGLNATASIRTTGLICVDGSVFLFAEISALYEGLIGEWLDLGYTWEIWNKDNGPKLMKLHIENTGFVPQCTYDASTIKGTVSEAGDRTKFIKNALIEIRNSSNNKIIKQVYSDNNGQYTVPLQAGTYKLAISKEGYIPFNSIETVGEDEVKYIETFLMVEQGEEGEEGIAGGKITNAINGESIPEVLIKVRNNWNNLSGAVVAETSTDQDGKYEVKLPLGNYTVEMIKEGYISNSYNIFVASGSVLDQNNTLVPNSIETPAGDLRIVLTWGLIPRDLDSHLVGPNADGTGTFHIYFSNKKYTKDGTIYADLDLDDTLSYGPETTTIYKMNSEGKYSFYVHDYTNRNYTTSSEMSNSGAKIEVYKGDTLCSVFRIPTNVSGTYWHVFDYDASTNRIIPVNTFVSGIEY